MRIRCLTATLVALNLICCLGANALFAQNPGATNPVNRFPTGNPAGVGQPAPTGMGGAAAAPARPSSDASVVVIDISEVFKNHARFKSAMEEIKEVVKSLEGGAQAEQKALVKKREQLTELTPGSVDYKRLEEEMARGGSQLQVDMALKQKEVMEREAKVYFNTYMEVQDLVKEFAEKNGIRLVLRYSRMEMDPTKRDTVLQGVNRPIVYQRNLDITDLIISQCNRGVAVRPDNRGPAIPRPTTR